MRRLIVVLSLATILGAVSMAAQPPDRAKAPVPGPPPVLTLPPVQQLRLSNGLPVRVVEMHEVPVVQIALVVRAGASADPAGKDGVASLTAAMLDEGAGTRGALEIADEAAFLGASLSTGSSYDGSFTRVSVPVARMEQAVTLLSDIGLKPTFPQAELERVKQQRITAMMQARDDPDAIAGLAFPRLLFGPAHRYGTDEEGTQTSLRALAPSDLRAFYDAHYRPDNAVLIVVGDVTPARVQSLLEPAFGSWKPSGGSAAASRLPAVAQPKARRILLIDKPGAAQSEIRIGWVGVPRSTPDYFPLTVLNTILGGSFTSRLNTNLRETHGYSYGAFSSFQMRRDPGAFVAAAGVQTDKTAESVREFFNELEGIRKPIPGEEFGKARRNVALGFATRFETTGALLGGLIDQYLLDLPEDVFTTYVPRVQQVAASDVARVAQQYIQPSRFLVVVVGDRATVEAPLRALNLGPVSVMSVQEALK